MLLCRDMWRKLRGGEGGKWPTYGSRMDTWRIRIRRQGSAGQLERTERNHDARVEDTRPGREAVHARRACMRGQLGPTRLQHARIRHVAALVSWRGSAPIGLARRTAG